MQTWTTSIAAIVLLALGNRQDSDRLVDDMIARSNALKSFVATYKGYSQSKDAERKETGTFLRLVYRAPDDLLADMESGDLRTRSVVAGGSVSVLIEKEGRPFQHGEAEFETTLVRERERIARAFHEEFPALGDVGGSPSVELFVGFTWKPGTDSQPPSFTFQVGNDRGDGPLLDWLDRLKRSSRKFDAEGDSVVWEPAEGIRVFIRKDSGFIEKVVVIYQSETNTLELTDLALDTEVKDAEFQFADIDPSTQDVSESMSNSLGIRQLMFMRDSIHRKIREGAEADRLEWTSDARASLGKVLRVLHGELAPLLSRAMVDSMHARIDKYCVSYQEKEKAVREGGATGAEGLEEGRVEWEAPLRKGAEESIELYLARAVPAVKKTASKLSGEARSVELEAAEAAYRKTVVEPILEYFTEQVELASRGELPPTKH